MYIRNFHKKLSIKIFRYDTRYFSIVHNVLNISAKKCFPSFKIEFLKNSVFVIFLSLQRFY